MLQGPRLDERPVDVDPVVVKLLVGEARLALQKGDDVNRLFGGRLVRHCDWSVLVSTGEY